MSDIEIAWNRPSNADYSHTLIRWTDRNGVGQERRFDADTSIGIGHRWRPGLEDPALRFAPGLHRLEMISADTAGNLSAPVRLRLRTGLGVNLPIHLFNNLPLIDLHKYDAGLDAGDPLQNYTYTVIEGNDSYEYIGQGGSRLETHDRFRTAADTTRANTTKCPPGWLCTHKALAHYYDPDDMPARIERARTGGDQYTYARTQADQIVVRLQHPKYRHDFPVTVSPNPEAIDINRRCAALSGTLSRLDRWLCINGREIIPTDLARAPTKAEVCALPAELRQTWGNDLNSYQLAVSADFNHIREVEKLFSVEIYLAPEYWESTGYPAHEVSNGAWIQRYEPVRNTSVGGFGIYELSGPTMDSRGRFEFSSGYLEVRQLNDIPLIDARGPYFILWSRYGHGHDQMSEPPDLSIFDEELRTGLGQRVDLDAADPLPSPYFLPRNVLSKVGFLEIDFWERWALSLGGPLWVVHTYPYGPNQSGATVKHGQRYTIPENRVTDSKKFFYEMPIAGPFVSGLEINPDSEQSADAIRFYMQHRNDPIPLRSASQSPSVRFSEAVSHTAPVRIFWRNYLDSSYFNLYRPQCIAEIHRVSTGDLLRCQSPYRAVAHNDAEWRFDYLRLWKRRGSGLPERLGGTAITPQSPRPFSCDND